MTTKILLSPTRTRLQPPQPLLLYTVLRVLYYYYTYDIGRERSGS